MFVALGHPCPPHPKGISSFRFQRNSGHVRWHIHVRQLLAERSHSRQLKQREAIFSVAAKLRSDRQFAGDTTPASAGLN